MNEAIAQAGEEKIQAFEREFLKLEQVDCPVTHRFGPGVYIREVALPAGACIIGHYHRHPHFSVMLKGKLSLINDDGTFRDMEAPITLLCPPGRKIAVIHEDVVWQNIYSTEITDVELLENELFEKSLAWKEYQNVQKLFPEHYIEDIEDFKLAITEFGFDEKTVRQLSENEDDQIPMPWGVFKFAPGASEIEGKGVFATANIEPNEVIGPARIAGMRTPLGRYTNHAKNPNARMILLDNSDIALVANTKIKSGKGGDLGEEITVDYREAIKLNRNLRCPQ